MNFTVKRTSFFNIPAFFKIARILKDCGDDMHSKYGLNHWKNSYFKTLLIVYYTALRHRVYGVYQKDTKTMVATFQTRKVSEDKLGFSKLAVSPKVSGKGCGSACLSKIEELAKSEGFCTLTCEVYEKSEHAYEFYKKRGYVTVGSINTRKYCELILEKRM